MKSLKKRRIFAGMALLIGCAGIGLAGTNTWTGSVSAAWRTGANWSTAAAPADHDGQDVLIPAGCPHDPELSEDAVVDGSVFILQGATLTLSGHDLGLVNLDGLNTKGIRVEGTLDASVNGSTLRVGKGGFINTGDVLGFPELVFSGYSGGPLSAGGAVFSRLLIDTTVWCGPTLGGDLRIQGDVDLYHGVLDIGQYTLSVGGSWFVADKNSGSTILLRAGENSHVVFESNSDAELNVNFGVTERTWFYNLEFAHFTVNKPEGVLVVTNHPVAVNGLFNVVSGRVDMADGGEVWLGVERNRDFTRIYDVALKLKGSVTPENMPDIVPAETPEFIPGQVRIIHNYVGPELPASTEWFNVAPFADLTTFPYTTMAGNLVDPDEALRTRAHPERGTVTGYGVQPKSARYTFGFDAPLPIARVSWSVPTGGWALLADTTGDGDMDRLLRMDPAGVVTNPGGVWVSRAWLHNTFWPPVEAHAIQLADLSAEADLYDIQIQTAVENVPGEWIMPPPKPEQVPLLEADAAVSVPEAAPEDQIHRGFHIEPWMFGLREWILMDAAERPPLNEYAPFRNFVEGVQTHGGKVLNMWPPTAWEAVGPGTYEHEVLWPSDYDRHSLSENVLETVVDAFHQEGLLLFTMRRVSYPKDLEQFPASPTRDLPAPFIPRHSREYMWGIVREQTASGVDGVGIGFDEQVSSAIRYPAQADDYTRTVFEQRYNLPFPEEAADTEAFRKWIVFAYEEFAEYLGEAARAAKQLRPEVFTKSPVHLTLGTLWNDRLDVGIAEDIVGSNAPIDFNRAYAYFTFDSLGHYVTALSSKMGAGAAGAGGVVSLHNCPWASDPDAQPGFYAHFPPVYMRGTPISSFMHGARMPLFWRYQAFMFYGGYDQYAAEAFSILDTLSAWGGKRARTPKSIAVLRSRTSEDWWQLRQRYHAEGNPMDQIRGYVWLKNVMELLLREGYPFDVFYLDMADTLEEKLEGYDLIILPFPYSVGLESYQVLEGFVNQGVPLILLEKQGETDEWGRVREEPLFSDWITSGKAILVEDDVPVVGHHDAFRNRFMNRLDGWLGTNKWFQFERYGEDVEFAALETESGEWLISLINWTDREVEVDLGLPGLPGDGNFRILQRNASQVRASRIGDKTAFNSGDLGLFRVPLDPWEVKVLCVGTNAVDLDESYLWNVNSGDWFDDANWLGGIAPGPGDAVTIPAGASVVLSAATPDLGALTLFGTLLFTNWNTTLSATNVWVESDGVMTCAGPFTDTRMSNNVYVVCSNLTIAAGGKIDANRKGYARGPDLWTAGQGPGGGPAAAGSHGGAGAYSALIYGDAEHPVTPGSGGRTGSNLTWSNGDGGGAIRVQASGCVTVDGEIRADGGTSGGYANMPGSGGSVWLTCHTIQGTGGRISADGGVDTGTDVIGGGGGRVAIHYHPAAQATVPVPDIEISVRGGMDLTHNPLSTKRNPDAVLRRAIWGELGTLRLPDAGLLTADLPHSGHLSIPGLSRWSPEHLTVTGWLRFPDAEDGFHLDVAGDVVVDGLGARLEVGGGEVIFTDEAFRFRFSEQNGNILSCGGDLVLTNAADLVVYGGPAAPPEKDYGAWIAVTGNVVVASVNSWIYPVSHITNGGSVSMRMDKLLIPFADSGIDADQRGFGPGLTLDSKGFGPGGVYRGGASHGGLGGGSVGDVYGSAAAPSAPGSGGHSGSSSAHIGRSGGGQVHVTARGDILLNGLITASGGVNPGYATYGASGGAVFLSGKRLIGTNGVVQANGERMNETRGSGAGGRIAVQYDSLRQADLREQEIRFSAAPGRLPEAARYAWHLRGEPGTLRFPDTAFLGTTLRHSGRFVIPGFNRWEVDSLTVPAGAGPAFRDSGFHLVVTNDLTLTGDYACLELGGNRTTNNGAEVRYVYSEPDGPVLECGGELKVHDGAMLRIFAGLAREPHNGGYVSVDGLMSVTGAQSWVEAVSHPTNGASVRFSVGSLTVDAADPALGGFRANARGYASPFAGDPTHNAYGEGGGSGGGSHGGRGGNSLLGPYGSSNAPAHPGSGGYRLGQGRPGGGRIWIEAEREVSVNGSILVDGGSRNGWGAGGGAGGGIYIRCHTFHATPASVFSACGGLGQAGSGGGGRIAVWRRKDTSPVVAGMILSAEGGSGGQGPDGEDGSIVWGLIPSSGTMLWIR